MHLKVIRMASVRISGQERKELEKFTKFLALKMVQIIVQSRLGEKLKTKSKPYSSGSDWFNVSVSDLPEVLGETMKAMAMQIPIIGMGMCVEISLKTAEGDTMVLENWNLQMTEACDGGVRVTTVYNRMSLLLKSLITVARVTPAYKLSMLQGSGSFVICYRVYMGESQWQNLGDSHQTVKVGQVTTPMGTLVMSVSYRTQLTISPQKSSTRDCPFMVKSDHFKPDVSPQCVHQPSPFTCHKENRNDTDDILPGCEDCSSSPIPCHLQNHECILRNGDHNLQQQIKPTKDWKNSPIGTWEKQISFSDCKKIGAFAGDIKNADELDNGEYLIPDVPFISLLQPSMCIDNVIVCKDRISMPNNHNDNLDLNNIVNNNNSNLKDNLDAVLSNPSYGDDCSNDGENILQKSGSSCASGPGDFVLVDLKPPFANADGTITDLGTFYRDCQTAPPLVSFTSQPSLAEQVHDLTTQLALFETCQPDFDDFVDSLVQEDTLK